MEQFPLGLIPDCNLSATVPCESGDLFALLSDGIVETEDAIGSEFGLEGIEGILMDDGTFGIRRDDQTLLLIRVTSSEQV